MIIRKVAVIGAGVMGSGIAAHIANAGIPVDLLDVASERGDSRSAIAEAAIARMLKIKPSPFMHPKNARLITPGNIADDLPRLQQADWVIEAVIEDLAIKQALYRQLADVCRSGTLISSNTSTLQLSVLTEGMPDDFNRRFMITHFFNPPRYMRLLELVTPQQLHLNLLACVSGFADNKLGKGCVLCHDTPGFIANRIGTFWMQTAVLEAIALNLSVEQCDAAMTLFGIPKTGVFGLLDLIGLDLMPHILENFRHCLAPDDPLRAIATVPTLLQSMIDQGLTGRKGPGGFYRLQPGARHKIKESIDLQTGRYSRSEKYKIQGVSGNSDDLRAFLLGDSALNQYARKVISDTLFYTAGLIPEIANDILAVDTAMRLGYNWRRGPFKLLDHLGVAWFLENLAPQDQPVPELLTDRQNLYRIEAGELQYKDLSRRYRPVQRGAGILLLRDCKRRRPALLENASASLWDIGDDIACLEFHSKMNTLDPDSLNLIGGSIETLQQDFQGLVIHNEADNFSAGANLTLLMPALAGQDWATVEHIIRLGQETYQALKYAPFPVVGAPSGLALGGGCEILLHCDAIQAHAELYMGLVEVGVGLELLFLAKNDGITMNKDRLLADAKARVQAMTADYQPPQPTEYHLPGASARAALDMAARNLQRSGKASAYDVEIARQLANVLSGGDTDISQPLTEQDLLDLELQAFLALVRQPATLARLEHMLKTGKPLRN